MGGGLGFGWGGAGEPCEARRRHDVLILVIQPFRLDQNTWLPRSTGHGAGGRLKLKDGGPWLGCLSSLAELGWDGVAKMGFGGWGGG